MYVQGRKKILQKNKPTESVIRDIKVCFCQTVICTSKIQSFNHCFLFTKRWFEIIRRDRGLSSHLCLTLSAKELLNVIKNSEWLWNNWPSLKTLKLSGKQFGPKADPSLKEINFKKVIFFAILFY